jgi:hypothetical protein
MATAKKTTKPGTSVAVPKKTSSSVMSIKDQLKAQAEAMSSRVAPEVRAA